MPSDIKKFINLKFLRTIDLDLMHELFSRHFKSDEMPVAFDGALLHKSCEGFIS